MKRLEEIARFCNDVNRCVAFYEAVLGVRPASWQPGQTATFMLGRVKLFLHQRSEARDPAWPLQDEDHIAFAVEDVDGACKELQSAGLTIEVGPRDFYWGRSAYLRDPDGRLVELHHGAPGGI